MSGAFYNLNPINPGNDPNQIGYIQNWNLGTGETINVPTNQESYKVLTLNPGVWIINASIYMTVVNNGYINNCQLNIGPQTGAWNQSDGFYFGNNTNGIQACSLNVSTYQYLSSQTDIYIYYSAINTNTGSIIQIQNSSSGQNTIVTATRIA